MTTREGLDRSISAWLESEAPDRAPDDVLEASRHRIRSTKQRRSWWPAWRFPEMTNPVRYAIAAAAVLVVALIGYQLLPSNLGSGGSTKPTADADAPLLPDDGPLEPGTYRVEDTGPTLLLTVPAGWVGNGGMSIRKHLDEPNEVALDLYGPEVRVYADACESAGTDAAIGPSVDDLLAALSAQEGSEIGEPVDTTVAGVPGVRLEISASPGIDFDQCSIGSLQIWVSDPADYLAGLNDGSNIAHLADTPDGRLIYVFYQTDSATAADIAERDAIIASMQIVP